MWICKTFLFCSLVCYLIILLLQSQSYIMRMNQLSCARIKTATENTVFWSDIMKIFKRIMLILTVVAMSFVMLVGCSEGEKVEQPAVNAENNDAAQAVTVEDMYSQIEALGVLPEMIDLDDAYISGYYGIAEDSISEKVFAVAEDALKADTVIIVKSVDESKAAEIKGLLTKINNQRMFELESYNPEQYSRVENAVINSSGCYVYYIVSDDNNAVVQIIEIISE